MGLFDKLFGRKKKDDYWFVPDNAAGTENENIKKQKSKKYNEADTQKNDSKISVTATSIPSATKSEDKKKTKKSVCKAENKPAVSEDEITTAAAEEAASEEIYYDVEEADKIAIDDESEEVKIKGFPGMFEIKKSRDGRYVFNLYARNHVIVATSKVYSSASKAIIGANSVIANAPKANIEDQTAKEAKSLSFPKWEMYIDRGGQYRFRLRATNGHCICHSQGYTTKASCKKGIDSIINTVKSAKIDKAYLTAGKI